MKTVLIYCHPDDLDLENKLLKTVVEEMERANHSVVIYRIFGDIYSPDLLSNEEIDLPHNTNFDATIKKIQEDILISQHMVFVIPIYGENLSHYLRRFADEVFFNVWKTGSVFANEKRLNYIKATIITSMRIPQILFSGRSKRGYSNTFTLSILKLCGIRNIKWFNIGARSNKNLKIKDKKIEKIREYIAELSMEKG